MHIFISTWVLLVAGLLCALPMIYMRVQDYTDEDDLYALSLTHPTLSSHHCLDSNSRATKTSQSTPYKSVERRAATEKSQYRTQRNGEKNSKVGRA